VWSFSYGMPAPVSRTRTIASSSRSSTVTSTRPRSGVSFAALWTRLATTCWSRAGSPYTVTGVSGIVAVRCCDFTTRRWRSLSSAKSTTVRRSSSSLRRSILPWLMRATSRRSSSRRARCWVWRAMTARVRTASSCCTPIRSRILTPFRTTPSGLRSSWDGEELVLGLVGGFGGATRLVGDLVLARVVDRDRRLGGQSAEQSLVSLGEPARGRVAEDQTAQHLARPDDGNREIASERNVRRRRRAPRVPLVAPVGRGDVVEAHGAPVAKRHVEQRD